MWNKFLRIARVLWKGKRVKHLPLLTLLVFAAPFGWGEEELVFYCVEDYGAEVSSSGSKLMPKSELKRVTYKISDKVYQGSSLKRWNITTRQDIFMGHSLVLC